MGIFVKEFLIALTVVERPPAPMWMTPFWLQPKLKKKKKKREKQRFLLLCSAGFTLADKFIHPIAAIADSYRLFESALWDSSKNWMNPSCSPGVVYAFSTRLGVLMHLASWTEQFPGSQTLLVRDNYCCTVPIVLCKLIWETEYIYMYIHVYTYIQIYICVYIYTNIHICTHMYIYSILV